ncbi:MAG: hypothetical protein LBS19_08045, partial [Clostridiales bacterium]|nr:hypothetical protein [Clostridiales bacterium]
SENEDFKGRLLIVKAGELRPEYRFSDSQLVVCSHGNGARPGAIGTSVFCKELLSGANVCYGRHQIQGIADPAKLPEWARQRVAQRDPQQQENALEKKPTLQEKLDKAKEKAKKQDNEKKDERGEKKKKRGIMEVD